MFLYRHVIETIIYSSYEAIPTSTSYRTEFSQCPAPWLTYHLACFCLVLSFFNVLHLRHNFGDVLSVLQRHTRAPEALASQAQQEQELRQAASIRRLSKSVSAALRHTQLLAEVTSTVGTVAWKSSGGLIPFATGASRSSSHTVPSATGIRASSSGSNYFGRAPFPHDLLDLFIGLWISYWSPTAACSGSFSDSITVPTEKFPVFLAPSTTIAGAAATPVLKQEEEEESNLREEVEELGNQEKFDFRA